MFQSTQTVLDRAGNYQLLLQHPLQCSHTASGENILKGNTVSTKFPSNSNNLQQVLPSGPAYPDSSLLGKYIAMYDSASTLLKKYPSNNVIIGNSVNEHNLKVE
jgi:hypothetical protein